MYASENNSYKHKINKSQKIYKKNYQLLLKMCIRDSNYGLWDKSIDMLAKFYENRSTIR